MKLKSLACAAVTLALAAAPALTASAQYPLGPGPAVAGSATAAQLPQKATKFLQKYYRHTAVRSIEREFGPGTFDVELADGTDIEFNTAGDVVEIEAPDRGPALSDDVVKAILPSQAYKRVKAAGQAGHVDEIELRDGRVYVIKTRAVKKMKYGYDVQQDTWTIY